MYKIEKNFRGFYITKETGGKTVYLSKIGKNSNYHFSTDYTYTKYFTWITAKKHLAILTGSEAT